MNDADPGGPISLIERDEPLEQLCVLAERTGSGAGSIALVIGEAGMGKSSLLRVFSERIAGDCEVQWGQCDPLFTPQPLGPLYDMARSLDAQLAEDLGKAANSSDVFPIVLRVLQDTKRRRVLIFEDIHWADHATLDLLRYIGRRIAVLPIMLVMSFRNDEVDDHHPLFQILGDLPSQSVRRIDLAPLSESGVRDLARSLDKDDAELYQITGGNPFFVTELLNRAGDENGAIPTSISGAISARIGRLNAQDREVLTILSAMPGTVEPWLLRSLHGRFGDDHIANCVKRGFLTEDQHGFVRFRHELVRLATLSMLPAAKLRSIHARILDVLRDAGEKVPIARIVHHAAGALDGASVLEYVPRAAEQAAKLGAHREAASYLATALQFVAEADSEQAAMLYENWAYEAALALRIDDEVIEARRHAITIWRALGRVDKVGHNLCWLSRLHWYRGEAADAARLADLAVRELEAIEPTAELARAYSVWSQLHMLNDRYDEAIDWGRRAISIAERFNNTEIRIHALNNVGTSLVFSGDESGLVYLAESKALALQHELHEHAARTYTNVAEYSIVFRNFSLAEKTLAEGIAYDTEHDLDAWTYYLIGRLAQLRMDQGRLLDAETIARGVVGLDRLTLVMRLPALTVLARVRARLGEADAAELLQRALREATETGEPQNIIPVRLGLIEAAWVASDVAAAAGHIESITEMAAYSANPWLRGEYAIWCRRCDVRYDAASVRDAPEPLAAELRGDFLAAAAAWESLGLPFERALALLQSAGPDSPQVLATAIEELVRIGALPAAEMARSLAANFGLTEAMPARRRGPYRASRQHPLGLTLRELEVLRLIVQGYTNRDIAAAISRSQRTIEHHVSSALSKLGAVNRMEATLRVQNEPWLLSDMP